MALWLKKQDASLVEALEPGDFPVGAMIDWPTDIPPPNWGLCNGVAYDPGLFPDLAAVIGDTFGVGLLPDLTGRFAQGVGDAALGEAGGFSFLIVPSHTHSMVAHGHGNTIAVSAADAIHYHDATVSEVNAPHSHAPDGDDTNVGENFIWRLDGPPSSQTNVMNLQTGSGGGRWYYAGTNTSTDAALHAHGMEWDNDAMNHAHSISGAVGETFTQTDNAGSGFNDDSNYHPFLGLHKIIKMTAGGTGSAIPTFVAQNENVADASSTNSVPVPTGTVEGDVMVAWAAAYGHSTADCFITPAGWTRFAFEPVEGSGKMTLCGFWKAAGASESATTFSVLDAESVYFILSVESWRGVDTSAPVNASATDSGAIPPSPLEPSLPGLTTSVANCVASGFVTEWNIAGDGLGAVAEWTTTSAFDAGYSAAYRRDLATAGTIAAEGTGTEELDLWLSAAVALQPG